jgi:hypothetical protein
MVSVIRGAPDSRCFDSQELAHLGYRMPTIVPQFGTATWICETENKLDAGLRFAAAVIQIGQRVTD